MARKKVVETPTDSFETADERVERLEMLFEQLSTFTKVISDQEESILAARTACEEAKATYEDAKEHLRQLEQVREGAKHGLYRFLSPKSGKFQFMPLFDRMEQTDEVVHGKNSTTWRSEPIAALKLSLPALQTLADADIVLVGQLQDRILESPDWWKTLSPLNAGQAAAIVDRLNDFVFERTK